MRRFSIIVVLLLGGLVWMAPGCASDPNVEGARLDLRNQDYERALENVNQAIANNPENGEAYYLKGQILQQQATEVSSSEEHVGIIEDMVGAYNRAVEIDAGYGDDVTQRLQLAYYNEFRSGIQAFNRAADNPDEFHTAAAHFDLATQLQPDSAGAYVNKAFALLNAGEQDAAVEPLETAIEKGDEQKNTFLFLGDIYSRRDNWDRALEIYRRAAEIFPQDPDVQSQLMNAYVQTDQQDEAMSEYRSAIEQDPSNKLLLYNMGSLLLEAEEYDEAISYLQRAVEQDAQYANAQYNLGAAYVNKAVDINERIGTMDDALRGGEVAEGDRAAHEQEMVDLAEERRQAFAAAIGPLETAKSLMESNGDDPQGVCQALFSAYVQTNQQQQAEAIADCAGYDDVNTN